MPAMEFQGSISKSRRKGAVIDISAFFLLYTVNSDKKAIEMYESLAQD
jgi:hypothetical protein